MKRDLCIMACSFCRDPVFHRWLQHVGPGPVDADIAKRFILAVCEVDSRNELDASERAGELFHALVRRPFVEWRDHFAAPRLPSRADPVAPAA